MSALIAAKIGKTVVLATDSRVWFGDHSAVKNDNVQKIYEIHPGMYFATCGWDTIFPWQSQRAVELGTVLGDDIRAIARTLEADRELRTRLQQLVDALKRDPNCSPSVSEMLAGARPIHMSILAGSVNGQPGFVISKTFLVNGKITPIGREFFGTAENDFAVIVDQHPRIDAAVKDLKTWA